jgi:hypothetical protein
MTTDVQDLPSESQVESVLTTSHSQVLHIPYGDRPLCGTTAEFRTKPLDVYPRDHQHWCRVCLRLWRDADGEERS